MLVSPYKLDMQEFSRNLWPRSEESQLSTSGDFGLGDKSKCNETRSLSSKLLDPGLLILAIFDPGPSIMFGSVT